MLITLYYVIDLEYYISDVMITIKWDMSWVNQHAGGFNGMVKWSGPEFCLIDCVIAT